MPCYAVIYVNGKINFWREWKGQSLKPHYVTEMLSLSFFFKVFCLQYKLNFSKYWNYFHITDGAVLTEKVTELLIPVNVIGQRMKFLKQLQLHGAA